MKKAIIFTIHLENRVIRGSVNAYSFKNNLDEDMIIVHCGNPLAYYNEGVLWHVADLIRLAEFK